MGASPSDSPRLSPLTFAGLSGWAEDDHAAALAAFRTGANVLNQHPPKSRGLGVDAEVLAGILTLAAKLPAALSAREARAFFEREFQPFEVIPAEGGGFFTGYYEPEVAGSLQQTTEFRYPLLRQPSDLVEIAPGEAPQLDPSFRFARRAANGYVEHPDRKAIMASALADRGLELVWLANAVDAFFIHIQGAARIRLADGAIVRVSYAAKSGHPYTLIGRVLIDMGALTREAATMQGIRAWLAANPAEAEAIMAKNRSFIFFHEAQVADDALGPIAAAKVPLVAERSLAVDRLLHTFHSPVWIETTLPAGAPFRRLMVAHDTGSAIVGPARGDIFFGSGDVTGEIAGAMRSAGRFVILMPRENTR